MTFIRHGNLKESESNGRTVVLALGGNAITSEGQSGTYEEMLENCKVMAKSICALYDAGWRIVITHGNGPQVGNFSIQQDAGAQQVPIQPLHALVAMTQGMIGHLIETALRNEGEGRFTSVVFIGTHVLVDPADCAFAKPTKPIGIFYTKGEAAALIRDSGWQMVEDSGRGYRRVAASPKPKMILESSAVSSLIADGYLVIAAGGGGIPMVETNGVLAGVEAVIDKDHAAALLATSVGADALVLVTGVDTVMLDFGKPTQRELHEVCAEDLTRYSEEGQFPPGSMGPKVEAALAFVNSGNGMAVITSARLLATALASKSQVGTRIISNTSPMRVSIEGSTSYS